MDKGNFDFFRKLTIILPPYITHNIKHSITQSIIHSITQSIKHSITYSITQYVPKEMKKMFKSNLNKFWLTFTIYRSIIKIKMAQCQTN